MLRQSSSRLHRSRGSKVKSVLQVCFLVAVSLWLIYQVKHSHDKRKEFDENDAKAQVKVDTVNLGRKDLHPQLEETTTTTDSSSQKHDGEDEAEREDNKHEDEQEGNNSSEEREDAGGNGGDDGIGEHYQEPLDTDDEEDVLDEEKKREENGLQGVTDKGGRNEKESSSGDRDGNVGSRNAHEAREEPYKADDASSAVTQAVEATNNRTENRENSTEKTETVSLQEENQVKTSQESLKEEEGEIAENGISSNVTEKRAKGNDTIGMESEENLPLNSTLTGEAVELPEHPQNSTEGSLVTDNLSPQNETDTELDFSNEAQNATSGGSSSGMESNNNQSDSNLLSSGEATIREPSNTTVSEFAEPEKVKTSNGTLKLERHPELSTAEKQSNATHVERSEIRNGTDDSSSSSRVGNADPLERSIASEDKNSRADVDLGTLPEVDSEGNNRDDPAAAE